MPKLQINPKAINKTQYDAISQIAKQDHTLSYDKAISGWVLTTHRDKYYLNTNIALQLLSGQVGMPNSIKPDAKVKLTLPNPTLEAMCAIIANDKSLLQQVKEIQPHITTNLKLHSNSIQ